MVDSFVQESPEQKTTRDSLGSRAIVLPILTSGLTGAGGDNYIDLNNFDQSAIESDIRNPLFSSGVLSQINYVVNSNTFDGDELIKLRKNGVDTGVQIVVAAGSTDPLITFEPIEFEKGDYFTWFCHPTSPITMGNKHDGLSLLVEFDA